MRREPSPALLALFTLLALAAGCGEAGEGQHRERPPVAVQAVVAASVELQRTHSAVGTLESPLMTTLASELAGTIVALDIPEGQSVEAGHELLRLDDSEARAALSVARARRRNARDRLARLENLRAQSVSSEQAYDDASSEFDAATGAYEEAQTRVTKSALRAPYTGALGLAQIHVGDYLSAGDPVVEITQVDPLELHFGLPQHVVADLAVGQTVLGMVGRCGPRFEGEVEAIDPRVDPSTRAVRLQARVPNPQGDLYPGMAVRVRLLFGRIEGAIVLPQEAVVRQGTKHLVYTVNGDGTAVQNEVTLGDFFVDGVHVVSGVAVGEQVVVAGQQKLRPGAAVEVAPHSPTDNPNVVLGRMGPVDPLADGSCTPP